MTLFSSGCLPLGFSSEDASSCTPEDLTWGAARFTLPRVQGKSHCSLQFQSTWCFFYHLILFFFHLGERNFSKISICLRLKKMGFYYALVFFFKLLWDNKRKILSSYRTDLRTGLPVPFPIWVSEPSRLHAQLQRLERKLPHLLISSMFAVLERNKAAMWNCELFNNPKGNRSKCESSSGGKAENQEMRIPWASISVPVDLISIWIVEVGNRLFHRLKGTGLKLCDNHSS